MFSMSLGWYWLVIPLLVALLGVYVLVRGVGHLFHGRPMKGASHTIVGLPLTLLGLGVALVALNTQMFARLTHESDVANVSVKAVSAAKGLYHITIQRLDGPNQTLTCDLQGDEWEIAARVQKWKPWANVLGLDTTYALDQVANKYYDASRGNGRPITSCDLRGPEPTVDKIMPDAWVNWVLGQAYTEQRRFGSAAYMPLSDGATYKVVMTQSGLNAEPTNDIAKGANAARP